MITQFGTAVSRRAHYYTDNGEDALVMWIEDMTRPAYRGLLEARFAALRGTAVATAGRSEA